MKKINNIYLNKRFIVLFVTVFVGFVFLLSIRGFETHSVVAASNSNNVERVEEIEAENNRINSVLDNNVKEFRYLYNYDGAPDYIYVELTNGGYAVVAKASNQLLEYSPHGGILDECSDAIIYGGPATYLCKNNNNFIDINTKDIFKIEKNEINYLSTFSREIFNNVNTIEDKNITDLTEQIKHNIPTAPPLDIDNPISPTAGARYIKNSNYFLTDPSHGTNNGTSCTTVATQLMLSYHNYYNDRRLIPDEFLNGTQAINPENNPNYCTDPMSFNSLTLGSNQQFHDYLFNKGITAFPKDAKKKLDEYLQERNSVLNKQIDYTLLCEDTYPKAISTDKILSELNSNNPVVLSTERTLNGTTNNTNNEVDHSVLAYGYQYLAPYTDGTTYLGYIVHFGWSSNTNQIWTNSAWYYTYLSLNISHIHNYREIGTISNTNRTEYRCCDCGHRTDSYQKIFYPDITNIEKSGNSWKVRVENTLNKSVDFYYNTKMCYFDDAQNWTGLTDINKFTLSGRGSKLITITENSFATSIAISYLIGDARFVTYADQLNANGSLRVKHSSKHVYDYRQNGMTVRNLGKNGSTWLIELTNNTGSGRTFEYNSRMCFEGDAQNWTGLKDIKSIYLGNGQTTTTPLQITEYGTATSIAISYMADNVYRNIFYAKDLDSNCTMKAMGNTKDTTVQDSCLAAGSLITLADGSQKAVEDLTGSEMLLVWNMQTGTLDSAPILFIDSDPLHTYDIINLHFSDETSVKVIYEHGFWDFNLNRYVYMDENAGQYIGHWFNKQSADGWEKVQLTDVTFTQEYTTAWSPVTYGHLCYYVNGMLSMPGGIDGMFNVFEVDGEIMRYDAAKMQQDIDTYGLFTYEEFSESVEVPEVIFEAINGQYLKVAIGKGLIDIETLNRLAERYAEFF